jgi:predicted aminopeptidase
MEPPLRCISRRTRRLSLILILGLLAVLAILPLVNGEARFLALSGYHEARILLHRRPLEELIADPTTPATRREQFRLVLAARAFARDRLGLRPGRAFTSFSDVGTGSTLVHVLSASPDDRLESYRWSYPIVGEVPYKGFFRKDAALAEKRRLERQGYDTYLRPSSAFSTLGWLPDPLLSTALDEDREELVVMVIHEIAHNTLWVRGDVRFNESYANFVGYRGAELFFASRGDVEAAQRCAATWRDEKRLAAFYGELERELRALYGSGLPRAEIRRERAGIFRNARAVLAGPLGRELEVYSGRRMGRQPLDNARILAKQTYLTDLDEFDRMLEAEGGDLRAGVRAIAASLHRYPEQPAAQVLALLARSTPRLAPRPLLRRG